MWGEVNGKLERIKRDQCKWVRTDLIWPVAVLSNLMIPVYNAISHTTQYLTPGSNSFTQLVSLTSLRLTCQVTRHCNGVATSTTFSKEGTQGDSPFGNFSMCFWISTSTAKCTYVSSFLVATGVSCTGVRSTPLISVWYSDSLCWYLYTTKWYGEQSCLKMMLLYLWCWLSRKGRCTALHPSVRFFLFL